MEQVQRHPTTKIVYSTVLYQVTLSDIPRMASRSISNLIQYVMTNDYEQYKSFYVHLFPSFALDLYLYGKNTDDDKK